MLFERKRYFENVFFRNGDIEEIVGSGSPVGWAGWGRPRGC